MANEINYVEFDHVMRQFSGDQAVIAWKPSFM